MAKGKGKGAGRLGFGPVKVAAVTPGGSPDNTVGGRPGKSVPQKPIAGPRGKKFGK